MPLTPGKNLGPYEILDAIGAGGMGEVYKARDTRLNRTVAIKVLPEHVASDPERKQRFEREAQAIAALNHPNICIVHDVGEDSGTHYIVMEYVEGETLAARLRKGALAMEAALRCAIEIGDALDKAHERGIVHRDLKPANIILTKSGAKLLDFGLAKIGPSPVMTGASQVPTNLTMQGTILGTPQYMSPEQVEGFEPDARADIFALGVVLYEMLTGSKAFSGKSQASLMASILEHEPAAISTLQKTIPTALDRIVRTCLAKQPEDRWQNVRDLVLQLKWIAEGGSYVGVAPPAGARGNNRERIAWSLFGVSVLGLVVLAVAGLRTTPVDAPVVEFSIASPDNSTFAPNNLAAAPFPQISPNGRHVVFVATQMDGRVPILWVRSLDSSIPRPLTGTEGAILPFWSADSSEIGFFAEGKLKRVDYSGGTPLVVSEKANNSGGAWSGDGTILFRLQGSGGRLHRISAQGGVPVEVTKPDPESKDSHILPHFLPDGRHFLYSAAPSGKIYAGSLDSEPPKEILNSDSQAIYAPPGYLLFMRQGTLMGQAFDAAGLTLSGDAFRIAENVRTIPGVAAFSVSDTGVLLYRTGGAGDTLRAAFFDRTGRELEPINQTGDNRWPRLSPDDSRIVVQRGPNDRSDIWIIDVMRGTNSRLTFNATNETFPIWSHDGNRVAYASNQNGKWDLYQKSASGVGDEELLLKSDQDKYPLDFSPDGQFLLLRMDDPKTGIDMWLLPLTGERKPAPFVQTQFADNGARFSPDGKWVAYFSNESGAAQIYVQPFPPSGARWQVSVDGGNSVAWARNGRELFFVSPESQLMSVEVTPGAAFRAGIPKTLFQIPALPANTAGLRFSVSRDGQRFLFPVSASAKEEPITVLMNWTSTLKK